MQYSEKFTRTLIFSRAAKGDFWISRDRARDRARDRLLCLVSAVSKKTGSIEKGNTF